MTSHRTISSLSITAIALMIVAIPSFAQAQADPNATSSAATQTSEQMIAANLELSAVVKSRVAPITVETERNSVNNTRIVSRPMLSARAFKVQDNFTAASSSQFVSPQPTFYSLIPSDLIGRKQFRADDEDASSSGRKQVSFVPSRGQKLPDQQSW